MFAVSIAAAAFGGTVSYERPESPCTATYDEKRFTEKQIKDSATLLFGDAVLIGWDCRQAAGATSYETVYQDLQSKLDAAVKDLQSLDLPPIARRIRDKRIDDLRIQAFLQKTEAKFFETYEPAVLLEKYEGLEIKECQPAFTAVRSNPNFAAADWIKGRAALCKAGVKTSCQSDLAPPPDPLCGFVGTDWFNCQLFGLRQRRRSYVENPEAEKVWTAIVRNEKCKAQEEAE